MKLIENANLSAASLNDDRDQDHIEMITFDKHKQVAAVAAVVRSAIILRSTRRQCSTISETSLKPLQFKPPPI